MTRLSRAVPARREQVYGDWWTVADSPTQPVTTSPTDWPPPSSSSQWGTRVHGHAPGERFEEEAKYAVQLSATVVAFVVSHLGSQAEELRGDAHIETDAVRDEYPIRHAWTFVIPPTAEQFAASKER